MANKTSIKDQIHEILYPGETKNLGHCRWKKKLLFRSANANVKGKKRTWKLLASRKIIIGASGKFLSTSVFSLSVSSAFSLYIYILFVYIFYPIHLSIFFGLNFFFSNLLYICITINTHFMSHCFSSSLCVSLSLPHCPSMYFLPIHVSPFHLLYLLLLPLSSSPAFSPHLSHFPVLSSSRCVCVWDSLSQ